MPNDERAPSFQFYPRDWMADPQVQCLSWDERGRYFWAICASAQTATPGVADETQWRKWMAYAACDAECAPACALPGHWTPVRREAHARCFSINANGLWVQRRMVDERKRQRLRHAASHAGADAVNAKLSPEKRSNNARSAAQARWSQSDSAHPKMPATCARMRGPSSAFASALEEDSKDAGAPRAHAPTNGHLEAVAGMVGALAESLSMTRTAPRAPLMTRVRSAVAAMSKTDQGKLYQLAGWLSKQITHDECLMRVVDDAIPRIKTSSIGNLFAYYSKDGLARCRIEGHFRADAQDNESKHWREEDWKAAKLFRAINGGSR